MHPYQRTESHHPRPTIPEDFVLATARPLHAITKPSLTRSALKNFRTTVTTLDFATGKPTNPSSPTLLSLKGVAYIRDFVRRAKPWIQPDGQEGFEDFLPDDRCKATDTAALYTIAPRPSSRRPWSDRAASKWLGMRDGDDYIREYGTAFHNMKPVVSGQRETPCEPDLPHAICYAIDSTPFDDYSIRTSEFKSIVFMAVVNNMKAEYNHLDSFGVTVVSFWNRDVRIVQGLVNLKTHNIDLRVSPVQQFPSGFRGRDGSIDDRFLTLLAYNFNVRVVVGAIVLNTRRRFCETRAHQYRADLLSLSWLGSLRYLAIQAAICADSCMLTMAPPWPQECGFTSTVTGLVARALYSPASL
ncbi:hypothetical protein G3M48_000762, partial [Beauveria asiatica]